jgi:hypothetical protein
MLGQIEADQFALFVNAHPHQQIDNLVQNSGNNQA